MVKPQGLKPPAHSKTDLVVHASWATRCRSPLLGPDFDSWARRTVPELARCARVLAFGNSDEHVHVVLRFAATISVAEIIGPLKGALSHAWNTTNASAIRWQHGYWVETCSPRDLQPLLDYVREQRERHRTGAVSPAFEPPLR